MKNLKPNSLLLAAIALHFGAGQTAMAQDAPEAVRIAQAQSGSPAVQMLFESRPYTTVTTQEQHFEDNLNLKTNQDQLPLWLTVYNGGSGKPGFNWFRLNIAGYLMASEQDMGGARDKTIDVTGRMQPGGGQILMDAAGEPGATLIWTLSTPKIQLSSVQPSSVQRGQTIFIEGTGFSSNESQDAVWVDNVQAKVLSAGPNHLSAQIPMNTPIGDGKLRVIVNSVESTALPISVGTRPSPVLFGTNFWMAPPGATLTVTGQNFASKPSENKVYFGNVQGQVVGGGSQSLTVVVPNWSYGAQQLNIPLYVVSDGVRSSNAMRFDIGPKYLGALPPLPGDSYSEAGSQASSQSSSQATSQAGSQAMSEATRSNYSEAATQAGSQASSGALNQIINEVNQSTRNDNYGK